MNEYLKKSLASKIQKTAAAAWATAIYDQQKRRQSFRRYGPPKRTMTNSTKSGSRIGAFRQPPCPRGFGEIKTTGSRGRMSSRMESAKRRGSTHSQPRSWSPENCRAYCCVAPNFPSVAIAATSLYALRVPRNDAPKLNRHSCCRFYSCESPPKLALSRCSLEAWADRLGGLNDAQERHPRRQI